MPLGSMLACSRCGWRGRSRSPRCSLSRCSAAGTAVVAGRRGSVPVTWAKPARCVTSTPAGWGQRARARAIRQPLMRPHTRSCSRARLSGCSSTYLRASVDLPMPGVPRRGTASPDLPRNETRYKPARDRRLSRNHSRSRQPARGLTSTAAWSRRCRSTQPWGRALRTNGHEARDYMLTRWPAQPVDWMKPSASGLAVSSLTNAAHGVPSGANATPR